MKCEAWKTSGREAVGEKKVIDVGAGLGQDNGGAG